MAMRNKYAKRSRISEAKIREIVRYVAADLTALQAAALSGLNRNTVNRLYRGVRERMRLACEAQRPLFGVRRGRRELLRGAAPTARRSSSASSSGRAASIPRSSRTARSLRSRASSAAGSTLAAYGRLDGRAGYVPFDKAAPTCCSASSAAATSAEPGRDDQSAVRPLVRGVPGCDRRRGPSSTASCTMPPC